MAIPLHYIIYPPDISVQDDASFFLPTIRYALLSRFSSGGASLPVSCYLRMLLVLSPPPEPLTLCCTVYESCACARVHCVSVLSRVFACVCAIYVRPLVQRLFISAIDNTLFCTTEN